MIMARNVLMQKYFSGFFVLTQMILWKSPGLSQIHYLHQIHTTKNLEKIHNLLRKSLFPYFSSQCLPELRLTGQILQEALLPNCQLRFTRKNLYSFDLSMF